jgi:hypothetical protein
MVAFVEVLAENESVPMTPFKIARAGCVDLLGQEEATNFPNFFNSGGGELVRVRPAVVSSAMLLDPYADLLSIAGRSI